MVAQSGKNGSLNKIFLHDDWGTEHESTAKAGFKAIQHDEATILLSSLHVEQDPEL